jgi:hypothetical protein
MFTTCAFCSGRFDGDGGPSGLGVGRRLAFDEWKGRLWVVCPKCGRWNLTPFDDRLERIETLARLAPQGRLLASTEQVALIRWQTFDLVRVGRPPRVELAAGATASGCSGDSGRRRWSSSPWRRRPWDSRSRSTPSSAAPSPS